MWNVFSSQITKGNGTCVSSHILVTGKLAKKNTETRDLEEISTQTKCCVRIDFLSWYFDSSPCNARFFAVWFCNARFILGPREQENLWWNPNQSQCSRLILWRVVCFDETLSFCLEFFFAPLIFFLRYFEQVKQEVLQLPSAPKFEFLKILGFCKNFVNWLESYRKIL